MQWTRSLVSAVLCWTAGTAVAANEISMTDAQSRALGIETAPLAAPADLKGGSMPAQVVIPVQQMRVVSAPLAGMVESVAVAANDPVKKGQVLARLQSPMLAEMQRDFLQALLQLQLARGTLERDEKLFKDGIVAESRYLAARNSAAAAAATAAEKRQSLRLAGMSEASLRHLQATRAIGSGVDVLAPLDGVVMEQMLAPGQRVEPAAPLFKIARLSPLWLEIQVPLALAAGLAPGAAVGVPAQQATGKVISVGRSVAEANQTVIVRGEITHGGERLRPGQYVEAAVGVETAPGQWSIPNAALVRMETQAYLFVQSSGGYRAQPVQVLSQMGTSVLISGKLRGDERVVVKGVVALKAAWQGVGKGGE